MFYCIGRENEEEPCFKANEHLRTLTDILPNMLITEKDVFICAEKSTRDTTEAMVQIKFITGRLSSVAKKAEEETKQRQSSFTNQMINVYCNETKDAESVKMEARPYSELRVSFMVILSTLKAEVILI